MKRSIIITLALIAAIAAPLCASSGWSRGLGVLGLGSGGGSVLIAQQLVADSPGALTSSLIVGQSFTTDAQTASTITVSVYMTTAGTSCEIRLNNAWLMETPITSANFTPQEGWNDVQLSSGVLSASSEYMFGIMCDGGQIQRSSTGTSYTGGIYRYRSSATWNITTAADRDLTFKVSTP